MTVIVATLAPRPKERGPATPTTAATATARARANSPPRKRKRPLEDDSQRSPASISQPLGTQGESLALEDDGYVDLVSGLDLFQTTRNMPRLSRLSAAHQQSALPTATGFLYAVPTVQGSNRPGYGGAQRQSKPRVQQGRRTISDLGPPSSNNKSNNYRGRGTTASRMCLPWKRPTIASKRQGKGSGLGVDPPALP
jgi:hypothetical protein